MRYAIEDEAGDIILVTPDTKSATSPMVLIEFREFDSDGDVTSATMKLDERKSQDLKQAINRSLRESERAG